MVLKKDTSRPAVVGLTAVSLFGAGLALVVIWYR